MTPNLLQQLALIISQWIGGYPRQSRFGDWLQQPAQNS